MKREKRYIKAVLFLFFIVSFFWWLPKQERWKVTSTQSRCWCAWGCLILR